MSEIPTVETIFPGSSTFSVILTRRITKTLAKRIEPLYFQILALNEAGKMQVDAAAALRMEVETLRNYVDVTGIVWKNITRRPRRSKSKKKKGGAL